MRTETSGGRARMAGAAVVGLGAISLMLACGSAPTSAARSTPAQTRDGACQSADPAASVRAASAAQNGASSYQLDTISTTQLGKSRLTLQVQQPDRFHFTAMAPDGRQSEFVAIGSSTWTKLNGTWTVAPGLNLGSLVQQAGPLGQSLLAGTTFTNASVDPNTTVAGQPAVLHKFHMTISSAQLSSDVQLWLASATCRPLKASDSFSEVISGVTSTGDSTTTWSGWNAVSIQPPA